ncbi:hypothetical protein [Sandaracinus amylolyticus]|uniref:hypothetical protein n=1 Tax=Sandaracinus amylolyticus TaxID=927083 RepID=UPI001F45A810|nr:hypothetical protein [Sandaracinus amylolyticus]UJR81697.1 Hypothetical protein I5071_37570 [Sandaracinus amylolyticus]
MSTGAKKAEGALAAAAQEFERELERYERLASELQRTEVSSEKTLARSKKLLSDASESEQRLGGLLGSLLAAMNGARDVQQTSMERVLDAAKRMQVRAAELQTLLDRFTKLGAAAREVHGPVAQVAERQAAGASADELLPALNEVRGRMDSVITEAEAIAGLARDGNWPDLVREASALRDQVQAMRNRVLHVQRDVAQRATS